MQNELHEEPSMVSVENGHVIIHCSSGMTFAFTPDAAVITSDRLLRAGLLAKRQETEGATSDAVELN